MPVIRPSTEFADMGARIIADVRQNDHCTADPIFLVQERKLTYGIDMDYGPAIEWQYGDEYTALDEAQAAIAEEFYQDWCEPPYCISNGVAMKEDHEDAHTCPQDGEYLSDLKRIGYAESWETVQPFFTEQAANHFIATNSHNYRKGLRVYVGSAYRNWEWQAVRAAMIAAAKGTTCQ